MRAFFDLAKSFDAAVWAAATSIFYGIARTGELVVHASSGPLAFSPARYPTQADLREETTSDGHIVSIRLPHSKSYRGGDHERIFWSRQRNASDPDAALRAHLQVNNPAPHEHLFTYVNHKRQRVPLTRVPFIKRLNQACRSLGIAHKSGHGLRIGGTLWCLLRGVPFDVTKSKGRWASDAFLVYLRRHAQVITPYIQAEPAVHGAFLRYAMPPVR